MSVRNDMAGPESAQVPHRRRAATRGVLGRPVAPWPEGPNAKSMPEYLTVQEVAQIVKLSPKHVAYRLAKEDPHFPRPVWIGKSRRYPKQRVLDWLARLEAESAR